MLAIGRRGRTRLPHLAEERAEARSPSTEVGLRRERQIDLQALGEEEGAVDRGTGVEVEVVQRSELLIEKGGPLGQNLVTRIPSHAEEEIDVRPAVRGAGCRRAGKRRPADAAVRPRPRE